MPPLKEKKETEIKSEVLKEEEKVVSPVEPVPKKDAFMKDEIKKEVPKKDEAKKEPPSKKNLPKTEDKPILDLLDFEDEESKTSKELDIKSKAPQKEETKTVPAPSKSGVKSEEKKGEE